MYNKRLAECIRQMRDIAKTNLMSPEVYAKYENLSTEAHTIATTPELTLNEVVTIFKTPVKANLRALEARYGHLPQEEIPEKVRTELIHHHAQAQLLEGILSYYTSVLNTDTRERESDEKS